MIQHVYLTRVCV